MRRSTHSHPGVLLTGATGFVGGEILARLLRRGDRHVYALIRADDDERASARLQETIRSLLGTIDPWSRRATAVAADLEAPDLGLDEARREWLARRTTLVIHSAATISFELGLEESRRVNVEGTRRMLDLAELASACGGLECFTHISTAYVAGDHRGRFGEGDLAVGQRFRNPYERSKFEAEALVRSRSLPTQVFRPSIVVGDSNTGWTPAFNVLYFPLRAFAQGNLPVLPTRRSALVDVVPVDYVASAVIALAGRPGTTYHLVAGDDASEMDEMVELGTSYLKRSRPRLIPPRLYRRVVHPLLVRLGSARRRRALRRSEQFFPYFEVGTRYDDGRAREALAPRGIETPPLGSYFNRLMDYAMLAEWGRRPRARHETIPTPAPPRHPEHGAGVPSKRWRPRSATTSTRSRSRSRGSSRAARTA
jgi:thioester reductase-like protein